MLALTAPATPSQIEAIYRSVLKTAMPGMDMDQLKVVSARLDGASNSHTNLIGISPPNANQVVIVNDGNNGSFSTAALGVLKELLKEPVEHGRADQNRWTRTAVLYHEALGHSPFSGTIEDVKAMYDSYLGVYDHGFLMTLGAFPEWANLPLHEWGFSRGSGFMVYAHAFGIKEKGHAHRVRVGENEFKDLSSSTVIAPAIRMNRFWEFMGQIARPASILPRSMTDRIFRWVFPPGIRKNSPEGKLITAFTKDGVRSREMGLVFARDFSKYVEEVSGRFDKLQLNPEKFPPTLVAVSPDDGWIDLKQADRFIQALGSGHHNTRHRFMKYRGAHNPFGNPEGARIMAESLGFRQSNR